MEDRQANTALGGNRFSLAILVAASFTFLATSTSGPLAPFEAQMRDSQKHYSALRGKIEQVLEAAIKTQLLERAWREMPDTTLQV